ncbi:hypothetical protein SAY86_008601 [Trapa natans]|uniref:Uncharacterized protein n=1 Tax=Trapa natans TaxID=22666 RepID=A0AAN7KE69_TRANT|nr:hypothetical protein SAY86_008601 [Trapa natans]
MREQGDSSAIKEQVSKHRSIQSSFKLGVGIAKVNATDYFNWKSLESKEHSAITAAGKGCRVELPSSALANLTQRAELVQIISRK